METKGIKKGFISRQKLLLTAFLIIVVLTFFTNYVKSVPNPPTPPPSLKVLLPSQPEKGWKCAAEWMEKKMGVKIEFEVELLPEILHTKLQKAVKIGEPPDLAVIHHKQLPFFVKEGLLMDLTEEREIFEAQQLFLYELNGKIFGAVPPRAGNWVVVVPRGKNVKLATGLLITVARAKEYKCIYRCYPSGVIVTLQRSGCNCPNPIWVWIHGKRNICWFSSKSGAKKFSCTFRSDIPLEKILSDFKRVGKWEEPFLVNREDLVDFEGVMTGPDGKEVSFPFESMKGRITLTRTDDPKIMSFTMTNTEKWPSFELKGIATGTNTASVFTCGEIDLTSNKITGTSRGTMTNDLYKKDEPIFWDLDLTGKFDIKSNLVVIEGEGPVSYPGIYWPSLTCD